jgi:hypothetical protein
MQTKPILLFNDECAVCRRIGHWVQKSSQSKSGEKSLIVQLIGDAPDALLGSIRTSISGMPTIRSISSCPIAR